MSNPFYRRRPIGWKTKGKTKKEKKRTKSTRAHLLVRVRARHYLYEYTIIIVIMIKNWLGRFHEAPQRRCRILPRSVFVSPYIYIFVNYDEEQEETIKNKNATRTHSFRFVVVVILLFSFYITRSHIITVNTSYHRISIYYCILLDSFLLFACVFLFCIYDIHI